MADDLKRVGIVFKADGSEDFQKTLKEIGTAAKENTNEFKKLTAEYDKNTTTTTKLQDKLEYATKQMANYQQRVETLQEKIKNISEEEKKNIDALAKKRDQLQECSKKLEDLKNSEDSNSEALKAAQSEYSKTQKEVDKLVDKENSYNSQINSNKAALDTAQISVDKYSKAVKDCSEKLENGTAKLEDFSKKLDDIGGKAEDIGKKMTNGITKPIMAVGAASIAAWKQVDDAMDTVIVKTGATGQEAIDLQNIVSNMAETMPFSFQSIGTAVGDVSTKFQLTGDALKTTSQQFLEFAQINGTDVGESISTVQQLLAAYGLTAADIPGILDQLNYTGQQTGVDMATLSSTVADNAASLQAMGLSAQDSITLVGNLSLSGVETSAAMMGLKKALSNAAEQGVPMSQALQDIQDKMVNAGSTEEAIQAATEIFGQKSAQAIVNSCRNGSLSFTDLASTADQAAGSLSTTFDNITDPADNMQQELNKVEETGAEIGKTLLPVLLSILQTITPVIKDFCNWWKSLPAPMQEFLVKTALVVAIAGPIIKTFGTIMGENGIGGFIKKLSESGFSLSKLGTIAGSIFGGIKTGATALFGVIAANPVVAIIVAIIAVLVLLYAKCKPFRDFVNKFFSEVSKFFGAILKPIKDVIEAVLKFFGINPKTAIYDMFKKIGDIIQKIIDWLNTAIDKIKEFFGFKSNTDANGNYIFGTAKSSNYAHGGIVKFFADGGILNQPTVVGNYQGSSLVAGEAGAEAILPLSGFYDKLTQILQNNQAASPIYVMVDHISEVEDLIRIQKEARQRTRMGSDTE